MFIQTEYIALTETWMDESVIDTKIVLLDYKLLWSDRDFKDTNKCYAGGLQLYLKSSDNCRTVSAQSSGMEFLSTEITTYSQNILFTVVYSPLFENKHHDHCIADFDTCSSDQLDQTLDTDPTSNIIICGDLNVPGYSWTSTNDITLAKGFHPIWQIRAATTIMEEVANRFLCKKIVLKKLFGKLSWLNVYRHISN